MFGSSLILFAIMIVSTAKIPKAIGYFMALSGIAYLAQSWIIGTEGFSPANSLPTLVGYALFIAWTFWLLGTAWRKPKLIAVQAT